MSKYLNIIVDDNETTSYELGSYINKSVSEIKSELEANGMKVFVLGTGEKVIYQLPKKGSKLYKDSVVVLLTDSYDKAMPNLVGLSYKDASNILKLMGVKYSLEGRGYVVSQNVPEGIIVGNDTTVVLQLNSGYN